MLAVAKSSLTIRIGQSIFVERFEGEKLSRINFQQLFSEFTIYSKVIVKSIEYPDDNLRVTLFDGLKSDITVSLVESEIDAVERFFQNTHF